MELNQPVGLFITIEGIEGAGKSTQARMLGEALLNRGRTVLVTREPGGTPIGDRIRAILLSPGESSMDAVTELMLYFASRAQHLAERVRPALESGAVVICDRYSDATLAYQGGGRGLDSDALMAIDRFVTSGLRPRRTYLLDLPVGAGLIRARRRNLERGLTGTEDRYEEESLEFHERVRRAYLDLAAADPARFCVVSAAADAHQVHAVLLHDVLAIGAC
ncbi:MAG: dTMP kinase [Candidatus Schekmanbacteria bacterium]|nr:dTMP kinase [Candidatus Schekmanbacteria bacterium]